MKTGHILALTALAFFTITILWSTQQMVPRDLYQPGRQEAPTRIKAASCFFQVESVKGVTITAPINVELDAGFSGFELLGDTSVLKCLWVSASSGYLNVGVHSGNYWRKNKLIAGDPAYADSIQQLVKNAGIRARIGTQSVQQVVRFRFNDCIKISAATPLRGHRWKMELYRSNLVQLPLHLTSLEIICENTRPDTGALLQLSGQLGLLLIGPIRNTRLAASQLRTNEIYIRDASDSRLDLFATDIVNILTHDSTNTIAVNGNPAYRRELVKQRRPGMGGN